MSYYIKTGYWDEFGKFPKPPKNYLNLDLLIQKIALQNPLQKIDIQGSTFVSGLVLVSSLGRVVQIGDYVSPYTSNWVETLTMPLGTAEPFLTTLSFNNMEGLSSFSFQAANNILSSVYFPSLKVISGNIGSTGAGQASSLTLLDFPSLEAVGGNIAFSNIGVAPAELVMNFPKLAYLGGSYGPISCPVIKEIDFPSLEVIYAAFNPQSLSNLTTINLPVLRYVANAFTGSTLPLVTTLSLPSLTFVGANFAPSLSAGTTLNVPVLEQVLGSISLLLSNCTTYSFPSLKRIGIHLNPTGAALTTVSLPSLESIEGSASGNSITFTSSPNLANFTFGPNLKRVGTLAGAGNVLFTSCALNQASVDNILVRLAALDGTNGTTIFSNRTVTITGTSATPSATGLAAKAVLQARGCTVTNN